MNTATEHFSAFATMWIDRPDAQEEIERRLQAKNITPKQSEQLTAFIRDGYIILKNAVPDSVTDRILQDMEDTKKDPKHYVITSGNSGCMYADDPVRNTRKFRFVSMHVNSAAVRQALFADPIVEFLRLVFQRDVLAFQTLNFVYGSQQAMHQDPAYVVVDSPTELVASWVALEDVQEGSGELMYYKGSHRNKEFLFPSNRKHWFRTRDGQDVHKEFIQQLHSQSKDRGLALEHFHANKGDVLLWHADLIHGGAPITNPTATRKSLVTHYCPENIDPKYFEKQSHRKKLMEKPGCYYSSWHYDLHSPGPVRVPTKVGNPAPARANALQRLLRRIRKES